MKLRVMVTMMAEVDVVFEPHADGGGAMFRPTIQSDDLIISYAAYDLPDNTPDRAKPALSTVCAHLAAQMATARLSASLNRVKSDEPVSGPTQPAGMA